MTRPPIDRLLERLPERPPGRCWLWPGASIGGYGSIWDASIGNRRYTHRVMYEHAIGDIPDGLEVDHLCRNRACCNPAHLEAVTHQENVRRHIETITHCSQGHAFDETNTYRPAGGTKRQCRKCKRARWRAAYRRRRDAA